MTAYLDSCIVQLLWTAEMISASFVGRTVDDRQDSQSHQDEKEDLRLSHCVLLLLLLLLLLVLSLILSLYFDGFDL